MKFEISWPSLIVPLLLWGFMTGALGGVLMVQVLKNPYFIVPLSPSWAWRAVLIVDAVCIASFLWPLWASYCAIHTVITDEYVSQPRLFGTAKIAWSQMEKITTYNRTLTLHGAQDKMIVNAFVYRNPQEVTAQVKRMADFHSVPTDF